MTTDVAHAHLHGGSMRAIVQEGYGRADVFRRRQVPVPVIAKDEVLVEVHAAGLDRGTWHLLTGRPYLLRVIGFGFRRPTNTVPGIDVAGTVAGTGAAVVDFALGDEVYGMSRGSFADYAAASESMLAVMPANLSFDQAAVVPTSAGTALQALTDVGHLRTGERVLVIGASGGVGSYAVQMAKALGAEVTGVCTTAKLDAVRAMGADHVVDYTLTDAVDGSTKYDLVLDIGGNRSLRSLRRALRPDGTLVIVGGEEGGRVTGGFGRSLRAPLLSRVVPQRLAMLTSRVRAGDLRRLTRLIESGAIVPRVDSAFSLDRASDAMRRLESGEVIGKVAIVVRPSEITTDSSHTARQGAQS